jgi:acyl-CoA dehydrogenase
MSGLARPLAEAAERLFAQRCTPAVLSAADGGQWQQPFWDAVDDLGPGLLVVPEEAGGAGGDWADAVALLEQAGAFGVPLPVAESVLGGWLRARGGLAGAAPGAVAFSFTTADLRQAAAQGVLKLDEPAVPWAAQASHFALVDVAGNGEAWVAWLPRDIGGNRVEVQPASAATRVDPAGRLICRAVPLTPGGAACVRLPGLREADVRAHAALLTAAEIAGALGRVLALSLAYTAERVKFGRAIGQFQAVQHQLAQLAEAAAAARAAVQAAACSEGTGLFTVAAATAKLRAGEAAGLAARIGHQLHGAIGVTAEHSLHRSTVRLQAWRDDEHGAEVARARALVQDRASAACAQPGKPSSTASRAKGDHA